MSAIHNRNVSKTAMRIETEGLSDPETFHQAEARRIHVRKALVVISA